MIDTQVSSKATVRLGLRQVGPSKPVGFLPLYTVADVPGLNVESLVQESKARGLSAVCFEPERCCIKSGAIYIYDRVALIAILSDAATILMNHRIPSEPDGFIQYITANWLDAHHPIQAARIDARPLESQTVHGGSAASLIRCRMEIQSWRPC